MRRRPRRRARRGRQRDGAAHRLAAGGRRDPDGQRPRARDTCARGEITVTNIGDATRATSPSGRPRPGPTRRSAQARSRRSRTSRPDAPPRSVYYGKLARCRASAWATWPRARRTAIASASASPARRRRQLPGRVERGHLHCGRPPRSSEPAATPTPPAPAPPRRRTTPARQRRPRPAQGDHGRRHRQSGATLTAPRAPEGRAGGKVSGTVTCVARAARSPERDRRRPGQRKVKLQHESQRTLRKRRRLTGSRSRSPPGAAGTGRRAPRHRPPEPAGEGRHARHRPCAAPCASRPRPDSLARHPAPPRAPLALPVQFIPSKTDFARLRT